MPVFSQKAFKNHTVNRNPGENAQISAFYPGFLLSFFVIIIMG